MWNLVNFSNVELWIHFSPDSVQRCWNFTMGSVLARLFSTWPTRSLDQTFQTCSGQVLWVSSTFWREVDPPGSFGQLSLWGRLLLCPPAAQLDFVAQFKLYLLLSARVKLADIVEKNFGRLGGRREAWNFYRSTVETFLGRPHSLYSIPHSRLWLWRRWFVWTFRTIDGGSQRRLSSALCCQDNKLNNFMCQERKSHTFWPTTTLSPGSAWRGLIPNFSDATMYTVFERRLWSATEFTFTWPSLRVEELCPPVWSSTLSIEGRRTFVPFMLWVTLPKNIWGWWQDCTLQSNWNFGMITEQVSFHGRSFQLFVLPSFLSSTSHF